MQLDGSNEQAEFYPLPPELNQALLSSLGIGGSRQASAPLPQPAWSKQMPTIYQDAPLQRARPGLLQPEAPMQAMGANEMDQDMTTRRTEHGPQCQSIPQLSVRHYGGTASQLWALCPDCGAFSKVHEDKPVILAYSP